MKYLKIIILILVVVFFFPKSFVTYPGYTTKEYYDQWENSKKTCHGFFYVTKTENVDSEKKDICFGLPL